MLNSIYELGKLYINHEGLRKIDILLDTEKLNRNTKDVLIINLKQYENDNFSYNTVYQEDFDSNKIQQYLYKTGSSNGTDITPSCLIRDPERTFNNKFFKWFEKNSKIDPFLTKIYDVIKDNKESIFNDLKDAYDNLNVKDVKTLLTLVITKKDHDEYVGDIDIFKQILIDTSQEKYYKSRSKKIRDYSTCFLCD